MRIPGSVAAVAPNFAVAVSACSRVGHPDRAEIIGSWVISEPTSPGFAGGRRIALRPDGTCDADSLFVSFTAACNAKRPPTAESVATCHWGIEPGNDFDEIQVVLSSPSGFLALRTAAGRMLGASALELTGLCVDESGYVLSRVEVPGGGAAQR